MNLSVLFRFLGFHLIRKLTPKLDLGTFVLSLYDYWSSSALGFRGLLGFRPPLPLIPTRTIQFKHSSMKALEVYQVSQDLSVKILEIRKCAVISPTFCAASCLQRNQTQNSTYDTIPLAWNTSTVGERRMVTAQDGAEIAMRKNTKEPFQLWNVLRLHYASVTWGYVFVKSHQTMHLNIHFIVCKLYINMVDE